MLKHQTITFLEKSFSFACFLKGISEAVARTCSVKKVFLEISQNFQENVCAIFSFFNKVAGWPPTLLRKRDPGMDVFLSTLRNF